MASKVARPPVPKFNEDCPTPKLSTSLFEEVQHLIYSMNLDSEVEKKAAQVLATCQLPNTSHAAKGLVIYCLKSLRKPFPSVDRKTEYVIKYIETQQTNLIDSLCERLGFDSKVTSVCVTLQRQMQFLIKKLPMQLQNAISVKIATDIIFYKRGGLNEKFLAYHSKVSDELIRQTINRIKPFAEKIMYDLFQYYNSNPL